MTLEELIAEIRSFFDDFEIDVYNLQKPSYVLIRDFFTRVLIELEVETDNIRKAHHLLDGATADYPEIVGDIALVRVINEAFSSFLEFGLFDLLSPADNPKRVVAIITKLMDYMNESEELMTSMEPEFDRFREFRLQFNELARENENLRHALADLQNEKMKIIESRTYMKNQNAILETNAQQLEKEYEECKMVAKKMSRDCEENREKLNAAQMEKEKLVNMIKQLKGEMVDMKSLESKEELKEKIELEKTALEKDYMERASLGKKYAAAHELAKQIAAHNDELCSLLDKAKDLEEALKTSSKEVVELAESVEGLKKELDAAENEVPFELECSELIGRKESATSDYRLKREELQKKLIDVREAIQKVTEDKMADEHTLQCLLRNMNEMTETFRSFTKNMETVMRKKNSEWENFKKITKG